MAEVTIYTTGYCPYCHAATALLTAKKVPFTQIDVTGDDAARRTLVDRSGGRRYEELAELDRSGRLDELLRAG
jgi:glutaredoxin 3